MFIVDKEIKIKVMEYKGMESKLLKVELRNYKE